MRRYLAFDGQFDEIEEHNQLRSSYVVVAGTVEHNLDNEMRLLTVDWRGCVEDMPRTVTEVG